MRRDISIITERAHLKVPESPRGTQAQERRFRQIWRKGQLRGRQLSTGETALLMWKGVRLLAQFDRFDHPQSHGWHAVNASDFEVST